MQERLQKILSARGICSRRKAEEYIQQGLVQVNGTVATLGQKADPAADEIVVDGQVLQERKDMLYCVMNKPVGVVTENISRRERNNKSKASNNKQVCDLKFGTCDFPTVRDLLPEHLRGKIYPVGRLDKDTSGLLLLTNDGVLAYRLTHPSFDHEKEYEVIVERPIPDGALEKLRKGITISGSKTKPAIVERKSADRFSMILTEGRNRQIRRMCQKVGYPVKHLRRVRITTLVDGRLQEGELRSLSPKEVESILRSVGL